MLCSLHATARSQPAKTGPVGTWIDCNDQLRPHKQLIVCGIAGFAFSTPARVADPAQVALRMANRLVHRGPDDSGCWSDERFGVGLGHRRLAIVDLSTTGHQPMLSHDGRLAMVFNGEIYNHHELRRELIREGTAFRGHSDSEVIVEAFNSWGIENTLPRLIGMFAIALWDRQSAELSLIRDHLGIKPLYWMHQAGSLIFASELKALSEYPGWCPKLDRDALVAFMRHGYIPAPRSVYQGVEKLLPGQWLKFGQDRNPEISFYWDFRSVAAQSVADRVDLPMSEATDRLDELLRDAVGKQMIADVPLGALLSGGIDSSLVAALMQSQSDRPVKTFSIGFSEANYDEAPEARKVATHLGTDHCELYVDPVHALEVIPNIPVWYDEPFADSSQIPTYLVCEMTRRNVTVVLSGDGGDELFAGYNRYIHAAQTWKQINRFPHKLRQLIGESLRHIPERSFDSIASLLPKKLRPSQFGNKAHKALEGIVARNGNALYRQLISTWRDPENLILGATEPRGLIWQDDALQAFTDLTDRMQYLDTVTYLPDDILTKVDRASMAVSLEARVPLLDHRVVEYAWSLTPHLKIQQGRGKLILRNLLERYVPSHLTERPKMGFGVPIDNWLRGPLRDWAENLLAEKRLADQGLLNPAPIRARWNSHLQSDNWAYQLWNVLMLQAWLDEYPCD